MRILIVCSANSGYISSYIKVQVEALAEFGVEAGYYLIKGKGVPGYLRNLAPLKERIACFKPDIIHAHYGLSGLLANLQRKVPAIVTFHGSDINIKKNAGYSNLAARLSADIIFVHPDLPEKIGYKKEPINIIPCGVNLEEFYPIDKKVAREKMGLKHKAKYILFSSSYNKPVKNYQLAKEAKSMLCENAEMIELSSYKPYQVNLLMNAVDLLLVTSYSETGPLVVKEAMACNCPVVSTDVGDVRWVTGNTSGCYITTYDSRAVADKIKEAFDYSYGPERTNGRIRITNLGLESKTIATRIFKIYQGILE